VDLHRVGFEGSGEEEVGGEAEGKEEGRRRKEEGEG
jgi:hypothetical protein